MSRGGEDFAGLLMPKTVIGLAVWILMFALGAAVSGIIFFAIYQQRLNSMEERFIELEEKVTKDFDSRIRELEGKIENASDRAAAQSADRVVPSTLADASQASQAAGGSVVRVQGTDQAGASAVGSGVVVKSSGQESWILTNHHLVAGALPESKPVPVRGERASGDAEVYVTDEARDLAILVLRVGGLKEMAWSSAATLKGMQVFAVGAGSGAASAVQAALADADAQGLLLDKDITPQMSGGALLDAEGRLLGVLSNRYSPPALEGSNRWAVPIRLACSKVLRCPAGVR